MDIVIKNGIKVSRFDDYIVYQMYTDDATEYYMCTPTNKQDKYKMIIDFPEEYYKALLQNETVSEIKRICDSLYSKNNGYIYILTNVTTYELNEANTENDGHAYATLLKQLQKYTFDAYKSLTANGGDIYIDTVIDIVMQTDDDKKFIDWLDINLNGYFNGVNLNHKNEFVTQNNDDSGWTTLGGPSSNDADKTNTKSNVKTKVLVPSGNKHGFSNFAFIVLLLFIAIIMGVGFSLLLFK